jgi:O-acetyl-ADP-ribose deacetylase (regulator of RNase III)
MKEPAELIECLHVEKGDITRYDVDAIVNAANTSLLGGGGVDGAIHRAAGPALLEECRTLGGCRPGEAKITGGYNLKARHVIHTPGPVYRNGKSGERDVLASSYRNSMILARDYNLRSIAFPAISTGVYGYPRDEACEVAVSTVLESMKNAGYRIDVYFVLFDNDSYNLYLNYIEHLKQ